MPRYHVIIKKTSLVAVEEEMRITVMTRPDGDILVDLRAANPQAAEDAVKARLPKGNTFTVKSTQQVPT